MRQIVPALALAGVASLPSAVAAPQFVNGLALDGDALDVSGGTDVNNGRLGYFSDIHYDAKRKHWGCPIEAPAAARSITRRECTASRLTSTRRPVRSATSKSGDLPRRIGQPARRHRAESEQRAGQRI